MTEISISELVAGVQAGRVISFPTDTVPALAALPEKAELIFDTKQRRQDKPLILMAGNAADLWDYVQGTKEEYQIWHTVTEKHWPGGLTLVLPASKRLPKQMNPLDPTTIGIRVPNSEIARSILAQTGPLATTSANLSGQAPLESMVEIAAQFPTVLTLALTEFPTSQGASGIPSTVAKWTSTGWQILRQGAVRV
ncbi:MAG: L-threonylcarbamoyladenylate synthase [Nostocaceae cyanobacterium]|nr:L-threonylcarbamoyladenylate synthase [Nostocaceae cyanobacterium]